MLPKKVHAGLERFHSVQCRNPLPRRAGGVGRPAEKCHFKRPESLARENTHSVLTGRVPIEADVHIIEKTVPNHKHFCHHLLFGRGAVNPDSSFQFVLIHCFFQCQCTTNGSSTKQGMAAAVSPGTFHNWINSCLNLLGKARQGIILRKERHNRFTFSILGNKGRRHIRNTPLYFKPCFFKHAGKEFCRLVLFKSDFRIIPNCFGSFLDGLAILVNPFGRCFLGRRHLTRLSKCQTRGHKKQSQNYLHNILFHAKLLQLLKTLENDADALTIRIIIRFIPDDIL